MPSVETSVVPMPASAAAASSRACCSSLSPTRPVATSCAGAQGGAFQLVDGALVCEVVVRSWVARLDMARSCRESFQARIVPQ